MDVGTMAALSSINMLNVAVAIQNAESIIVSFEKEKQFTDMTREQKYLVQKVWFL